MATEFYPYETAQVILDEAGVEFDEVYNDRDGITRAQLTVISQLSNAIGELPTADGESTTTLKESLYGTIHKLHASANKKNIDFAANVKNSMYNATQFAVMEKVENDLTPAEKEKTMIKWLPSSADEADPFHALQYGKVMTLERALELELGIRYGCQCGMQIVSAPKKTEEKINNLPKI